MKISFWHLVSDSSDSWSDLVTEEESLGGQGATSGGRVGGDMAKYGDRGGSSDWVRCNGSCSRSFMRVSGPNVMPNRPASEYDFISFLPLMRMPLVWAPCDTIFT